MSKVVPAFSGIEGVSPNLDYDPHFGREITHLSDEDLQSQTSSIASNAQGMIPGEGMTAEEDILRKDEMMGYLLDSLAMGKDIGPYGKLVFTIIARYFLAEGVLISYLTKDPSINEEEAHLLFEQVKAHHHSPPTRDKILEWQHHQEFPIIVDQDKHDLGNVFKSLTFPDSVHQHLSHQCK